MKNNLKTILKFSGLLLAILLVFFALQLHFSSVLSNFNLNILIGSYFVNFLMATLIFTILIFLKQKHSHLLGFIYMGGSLLKFAVYFLIFSPIFKADGQIDKMEALIFLIPYFTCLAFETTYLIKLINK
jgi:hypothetical protein